MKLIFIGGALLAIVLLSPTRALAISLQGVGLAAGPAIPGRDPGGFHYISDGGSTLHDTAKLINTSQQSKQMLLSAVKAEVSKANRIDCASKLSDDSWVSLPKRIYTVPAETTIDIPVIITVPSNFKSGEYQACLVAQEHQPDKPYASVPLNTRVAMRLTVTPLRASPPNILLSELTIDYTDSSMRISAYQRNTEPITAISQVQLSTAAAWPTATNIPPPYSKVLLPSSGSSIDIQTIKRPFWGGYYRFKLSVTSKTASSAWTSSKQTLQLSRRAGVLIPPKLPAIGILLASGLILSGLFLYIYKRSRH